ncbi:MAG TPA: substrate-binding domain-containing protein, partial [Candidatus Binatus sp.]|nr:substrate-binding domain-containing protein [Candidatus Binatus sp.]
MAQLKALHTAGSGLVGVILPDTTSSTRYVAFDEPYLKQAFTGAGYSSSEFTIANAQGDVAKEISLAQAQITQGAKVLIFDPLDKPTGEQIQQLAASHGVKAISYDRATFTGTNTYYVSFDNVAVGKLIGKGFMDCVTAWGVSNPKVFTLDGGEDTDPNAFSFAQGYNQVIWNKTDTPLPVGTTNSAGYTLVGDKVAPKWDNSAGQAIFQQSYLANKSINATVEANDGLGNAVITVLKSQNVAAKKIPTT